MINDLENMKFEWVDMDLEMFSFLSLSEICHATLDEHIFPSRIEGFLQLPNIWMIFKIRNMNEFDMH